jgi:hypothetical protein
MRTKPYSQEYIDHCFERNLILLAAGLVVLVIVGIIYGAQYW